MGGVIKALDQVHEEVTGIAGQRRDKKKDQEKATAKAEEQKILDDIETQKSKEVDEKKDASKLRNVKREARTKRRANRRGTLFSNQDKTKTLLGS